MKYVGTTTSKLLVVSESQVVLRWLLVACSFVVVVVVVWVNASDPRVCTGWISAHLSAFDCRTGN